MGKMWYFWTRNKNFKSLSLLIRFSFFEILPHERHQKVLKVTVFGFSQKILLFQKWKK